MAVFEGGKHSSEPGVGSVFGILSVFFENPKRNEMFWISLACRRLAWPCCVMTRLRLLLAQDKKVAQQPQFEILGLIQSEVKHPKFALIQLEKSAIGLALCSGIGRCDA